VIRQLAFDLPGTESRSRADFLVAPSNKLALGMLDGMADWPQGRLVLVGPEGSGKTHLAHVWAADAGAAVVPASALADIEIGRIAAGAVAVDDADRLGGDAAKEAALFHLLNYMGPERPLLLTARTPPRDWGIALPDLFSRLQAAPVAVLQPPDDALLSAVLVKLFADRQIAVAGNLIPYLVSRMTRQIAAARQLVAALDARALAEARPITRALAGEVLDSLDLG
jgi:chromosomal replication initiation ATPase DnaA